MQNEQLLVEAMAQGVNRFLFYCWNYELQAYRINNVEYNVPEVILKAEWSCSVDHMVRKWLDATQSGNSDAYFTRFYAELDADNRRALLNWIMCSYNGEIKL